MVTSCPQNNVIFSELSDMNPPGMMSVKRQRTKSPVRPLQLAASYQSPFDVDYSRVDYDDDGADDVPFLSDCDADVAESFVLSENVPNDADADADVALLILSLAESSREELSSWERDNCSPVQAVRPLTVAAGCGSASGFPLSRSGRRVSCVRFARELEAVVEIPSHRSLTVEEKRSMYRDKRTVHVEKEISRVERRFERSRYCSANALEEECFFRNHLGELVHPAHWVAFLRDIYPSFAREPFAPPGFSSAKEYYSHLSQYKRFFRKAVEENDFPPPEL